MGGLRGRLAWAIAASAAIVAALLVVAHAPPVTARVTRWLTAKVASAWHLDLKTSGLRYNLFTRRVSLDDVQLSAPGHEDTPFFTARRVSAALPWAVFGGVVRLNALQVDDGRVHLVREGGTLVNLPPSSGDPPPVVPRHLAIAAVVLSNLSVDYDDRSGDANVTVRGLNARLAPGGGAGPTGPLDAASIAVRLAEKTTTSGAVHGTLAFDGSHVSFEALTMPFREATVIADGRVVRALDDATFDLALHGTTDLSAISEWTPPPVPVSGAGTFTGRLDGPLGRYELGVHFVTPAAAIGRARELPLDGQLSVTSARARIAPFRLEAPGPRRAPNRPGVVEGTYVYEFGGPGAMTLDAAWRDLDFDVALAAYDQDALAIATWQDGRLTLRRENASTPVRMSASGTSAALARRDRVAVAGHWQAELRDEQWVVDHDHRLLETVHAAGRVSWRAATGAASPALEGPLSVDIENVGPAIRAARASGINLSESLVAVTGPAHGVLAVQGTIDHPFVVGRLESYELVSPTGVPASASANISYDRDALRATRFDVSTQGVHVSGDAAMAGDAGTLSGGFTATLDSLPAFVAPWTTGGGAWAGTATMTGTIGGTTDVPLVPWTFTSTEITQGPQRLGVVDAAGRLHGTIVEFEHVRAEQGPGRLEASGTYDYESGAYDARATSRGFRWLTPNAGVDIAALSIDADLAGRGSVDVLAGTGSVHVTPDGGHLAELIGRIDTEVRLAGAHVETRTFVPKLRAFVDATTATAAPFDVRGTAVMEHLGVETFALVAGLQPDTVSGTVSLSAAFDGHANDPASMTAQVNLQDVAMQVAGVPVRLERPAHLMVRANDVGVDDLALTAGAVRLTAGGRLLDTSGQPLRVALVGPVGELVTMGRAFGLPADLAATGTVDAAWESRGGIERATASLTVTNGRVTRGTLPAVENLQAAAIYDGQNVVVTRFDATWQGAQITGAARLPRALLQGTGTPADRAGHVDLTLKGVTQEALRPWVAPATIAQLDAHVSATLALDLVSTAIDGVTGTLVLDEATVTAAGVPIRQERPGRMSIAKGVLHFDDVAFSAGQPVVVGGAVTFGTATTFDVRLTGTPGLRPLSVFSPSTSTDGVATLDVRVTGTPAAPRFDGTITLDDAEIVLRDPRVIASDISGPILLKGDRIEIPSLTGFLNGGELSASGALRVLGVDVADGQLVFQARGVAVEYPTNVDSEVDASVTFSPGPGPPSLTGDVRVVRGSYRAAISLPALLALNQRAAAAPTTATYTDRVTLNLAISTVEDLIVDNNYGRFEAGADLRLQGTVAHPGATGRVDLREGGELFVLGGLYRLNASAISFTNPFAIEPDLSISAVTSASGYEDTLTLTGTLDRLSTNVSSTNPDARPDAVSLLLRTNSLNREDALALLSGELLGVGRALGLDSLRVDRGGDVGEIRQDPGQAAEENIDPATRLTLSKRLRSDVEVIVSQDLGKSGGLSAVVSYRPWHGVDLRATQRDNADRNYAIRHEITFGGAPVVSAPRRALPDVAAVTLEGAAAADEPALRSSLKVTAGKRFDFVRWREDLERLRAWYHARGYLEARVRASRAERPDGTTALSYRIAPGPRTELLVEGTPVSARLKGALERAWSNAVFDRFLVDELRWLVQVDLVQRNVIGAVVDAQVAETTDTRKVVRVSVRDGRQTGGRRLRYEGVSTVAPSAIDAQLRMLGIEEYVWMEPLAIVKPITDVYYAAGHRHTTVRTEAVRFEGDEAVLPVAVDEGPVTTLASVTYTGVDDTLREPVLTAARLVDGAPYKDETIDEARRRIEGAYRTRGYNHVVVTPQAAPEDGAHAVAVTFVVDAGPQQRLTDVVVEGTKRTHPSAVTTALGLRPDAPVDYAAWGQARKRVYDTNVFRQVDVRPEIVADGGAPGTEAVRARVTVSEWPTWRVRYGLQLDDKVVTDAVGGPDAERTRNLGVVGDVQNRNVLGRAFTLGLTGRVERNFRSSSTYLTFPTLFGRRILTNVFASATRENVFIDDTPGADLLRTKQLVSIEQRIRRGRSFEVAYGYRVSHELLNPFDPEDLFLQETTVGRFTGSAFFDRRNDPFDATRGWFGSASVQRLSEFSSNDDAIKLLGTYYRYQSLGPMTLASAVRIGGSLLDPLSVSERFFVGGADTVRGYSEDAAGPRNFLGIPRGGSALLILNQEVRGPIYRSLKGVVFVDAGNVFDSNRDISFGDLQVGYGVGLRFNTPFSLLRFDVAWPSGGGARRFYFGIGQIF